jgi:hypothetical protein
MKYAQDTRAPPLLDPTSIEKYKQRKHGTCYYYYISEPLNFSVQFLTPYSVTALERPAKKNSVLQQYFLLHPISAHLF